MFHKFQGKTPVLESFLIKVAGLAVFNFIRKNSNAAVAKFLRAPIFKNICERLLLYLRIILFTMHEKDTDNNARLEPS